MNLPPGANRIADCRSRFLLNTPILPSRCEETVRLLCASEGYPAVPGSMSSSPATEMREKPVRAPLPTPTHLIEGHPRRTSTSYYDCGKELVDAGHDAGSDTLLGTLPSTTR